MAMDKLDPLMLTDVDSDVKGDAFEYFLKASTSTKNDLGEYFTPRHIVKTMVRLVNPQIGEKIYDPFCGTGGFLIESFRYIYNNMARTDANLALLRENTVYGNEITNTARITKMNMILAGDGHSNIEMKDSLANPVDGTETYMDESGKIHHRGFDIVLAIRALRLQAHQADERRTGENRLHHHFRADRPQVLPRKVLRHEN